MFLVVCDVAGNLGITQTHTVKPFLSVPVVDLQSYLSVLLSSLCAGDPTVFGNLPPAPNIAAAVKKVIEEGKHSGYGHSRGKLAIP